MRNQEICNGELSYIFLVKIGLDDVIWSADMRCYVPGFCVLFCFLNIVIKLEIEGPNALLLAVNIKDVFCFLILYVASILLK